MGSLIGSPSLEISEDFQAKQQKGTEDIDAEYIMHVTGGSSPYAPIRSVDRDQKNEVFVPFPIFCALLFISPLFWPHSKRAAGGRLSRDKLVGNL